MPEIQLISLENPSWPETRALARVRVTLDQQVYDWAVYVFNPVTNWDDYLNQRLPGICEEITAREAQWQAIKHNPPTETITDLFSGETQLKSLTREDVVRPDIPDYYAKRRDAYPSLGEQLDAIWKGPKHPDWHRLQTRIQEVKTQFPKPSSVK